MSGHVGAVYVSATITTAVVAQAVADPNPWSVAALAIIAPIGPVLIGYLLTRHKLRKQEVKVQEIHVMVNSRLSATLDALQAALLENIQLKDKVGITVSPAERAAASHLDTALPLDVDL